MARNKRWTAADLPDLSGKIIVITGGNSGIGFQAASEFARKGAQLVLACRNMEKAQAAAAQIEQGHPQAAVQGNLI
jgi:NAD(P)-dependent dehydrogenase (short-subunit alcohol dehydrogenase family)